jgi:hypothetical protein
LGTGEIGPCEDGEAADVVDWEGEEPVVGLGNVVVGVDDSGGVEEGAFFERDPFRRAGGAGG